MSYIIHKELAGGIIWHMHLSKITIRDAKVMCHLL